LHGGGTVVDDLADVGVQCGEVHAGEVLGLVVDAQV
jgi:hypothetical protein